MSENTVRKSIEDLGVAAYLRMHGFTVVGRKGKIFYFDVLDKDEEAFNEAVFEYPNSPYHEFDSHIMALKKLPHYIKSA